LDKVQELMRATVALSHRHGPLLVNRSFTEMMIVYNLPFKSWVHSRAVDNTEMCAGANRLSGLLNVEVLQEVCLL
jgi:hypothetical protein